jgi:hypothetical protein
LTPSDFFVYNRIRTNVDPQKVGLPPDQWWCDLKKYNEDWCSSKCQSGISIPTLFETRDLRGELRAISLWPNLVNMLIVNRDGTSGTEQIAIVPKPFGPIDQGGDYFETDARNILMAHGVDGVVFVDTHLDLHGLGGEIHCATQQSCEIP